MSKSSVKMKVLNQVTESISMGDWIDVGPLLRLLLFK